MLDAFFATLTPMLSLFCAIVVGMLLRKRQILPDSAGSTMAKLETWVFLPALSFTATARYCTPETLTSHTTNVLFAAVAVLLAIGIATPLSLLFTKRGTPLRGVYLYALTFGNFGYMGEPLVQGMFGDEVLAYYKIFTLPLTLGVYTYGITRLIPGKGGALRRLVNPPTVALFLGVLVGILGIYPHFPDFAVRTLTMLSACMGPVAMLLAGFVIGGYRFGDILGNKKIYIASLLRMIVLPAVILCVLYALKLLAEAVLAISLGNGFLYLAFFAFATPLGMNTILFPEAYGGDSKPGAGMALVSHTMAVVLLPLMYALLVLILGTPSFA